MIKRFIRLFRFIFPKSKIFFNDLERIEPASRLFGCDRGTPIDRYYIESFLNKNSYYIKGRVLEVGDNFYSKKFGQQNIISDILHCDNSNPKTTIVGDLTKINTLPSDLFDCFICTQTFNFIYNIKEALRGCYFLLKKDGVMLGTVSGISQISRYDMDRWGDYWRFTNRSVQMLLEEIGFKKVQVISMGNVLSAVAMLQGIAVEDLPNKFLLDKHDEDYQLTICFIATK